MSEVWKQIPGFSSYEASDEGRIRKLFKNGDLKYIKTSVRPDKGYPVACLENDKGKRVKCYVHVFILTAFVGSRLEGKEACHNNGIKTDNRIENLRWDSHKANAQDSIGHGTFNYGNWQRSVEVRNAKRTFSRADIEAIRSRFITGDKVVEIAKTLNSGFGTIYNIVMNRSYIDFLDIAYA